MNLERHKPIFNTENSKLWTTDMTIPDRGKEIYLQKQYIEVIPIFPAALRTAFTRSDVYTFM